MTALIEFFKVRGEPYPELDLVRLLDFVFLTVIIGNWLKSDINSKERTNTSDIDQFSTYITKQSQEDGPEMKQ